MGIKEKSAQFNKVETELLLCSEGFTHQETQREGSASGKGVSFLRRHASSSLHGGPNTIHFSFS